MPIAFPAAPVVDQTYSYNGREWIWNGNGWALNINAGQVSLSWRRFSNTVAIVNEAENADLADSAWTHKVYL